MHRRRAGTIKTLAIAQDSARPAAGCADQCGSGVPDFKVIVWNAMFTHKDAPPAAVEKLNGALRAALNDPVMKGKLDEIGAEEIPTPEQKTSNGLRAFIASEIAAGRPSSRLRA